VTEYAARTGPPYSPFKSKDHKGDFNDALEMSVTTANIHVEVSNNTTPKPRRMRMTRQNAVAGVVFTLLLVSTPNAQAEVNFNVQAFRPSPHIGDMWTIRTNDAADHLKWRAGLMLNYGSNPLVYDLVGGEDAVITGQLTADLMASVSLWRYLALGVDIPLFLYNDSDSQGIVGPTDVSAFSMGDIALYPKVIILDSKKYGFGAGLALPLTFPTASSGNYTGDTGVTFTPTLILDMYINGWKVALNTGYRVREDQELSVLIVDDEFHLGGGLAAPLWRESLYAIGEINSYTSAGSFYSDGNNNRMEGDLGLRYVMDNGLTFGLGGGGATTRGYGSVAYRVFGEAAFWPKHTAPEDTDGDGINDDVDKCPTQPEDADGFRDEDGCPDPDDDNDGILDADDRCPRKAEDKDGYQDKDGCPDKDNDSDGIPDVSDRCPDEAEDKDGWEDEDGCPDKDNDGDGIPDVADKCPDEAEVFNGLDDDDGCPDKAKVEIKAEKIEILEKVNFKTGKATIMRSSFDLLDQVANIFILYPRIKTVRVEGHTDSKGGAKMNQRLSQKRADAVVKYLLGKGVKADRLVSKGFGEDKPVADNGTREGRARNRRVEFKIIDQE